MFHWWELQLWLHLKHEYCYDHLQLPVLSLRRAHFRLSLVGRTWDAWRLASMARHDWSFWCLFERGSETEFYLLDFFYFFIFLWWALIYIYIYIYIYIILRSYDVLKAMEIKLMIWLKVFNDWYLWNEYI